MTGMPDPAGPAWSPTAGRTGLVLALTLRFVRTTLLAAGAGMALATVVPAALGWQPTVVTSGSMAPAVRTGDVVVTSPLRVGDAATLPIGSVVLANDPTRPGGLLLHRVTARNPDGSLTTKGDANLSADSTPLRGQDLRGVGRLRIPAIGVPVLRARNGDWLPAIALVVITVGLASVRWSPRLTPLPGEAPPQPHP